MARERINPRQWASDHLEDMSISKVIPSALTLLGLCSGATAIKFALIQEWRSAVAAIFCAMVFDMLDGQAARWLGADSRFGGQLDSLADLVSFGLAPAVVVYSWSLSQMGTAGWIGALIFCICSAIRLARFNIEAARDEGATQSHPYFTGLPTPGAAGVLLLPLLLTFEFPGDLFRDPMFSLTLIALTSILMVSRVPTPCLKHTRLDRNGRIAAVAFVGVLVPLAVYVPWAVLITGLLIYLATIPFVISTLGLKPTATPPLFAEPEESDDLENVIPPG
ncbi:MAG TPA: CDP-diacylglycerol--serine O-phosphatidyltransferase [Micropepsaceae bacterium]|jgi:CDP-diacylglycerol--serine O-phosphatidyltransferase